MNKSIMVKRGLAVTLLLGSGLISLSLALASPFLSGHLVLETVYLLNSGVDIKLLQPVLNGLLAGGTVAIMPAWLVTTLIIYGGVSLYLAVFILLNPAGSLRRLWSLGYWSEFAWGPKALRKREILRRRRIDRLRSIESASGK